MYEKIFDQDIQREMDDFFINNLSSYGKIETLKKGQVINQKNPDNIYIILEGEFNQIMYSKFLVFVMISKLLQDNNPKRHLFKF